METKNFLGLDGLKRFWEKAKIWIINEITTKIAEIVAEAPEDLNTLKEISDWISTHEDSASAMNSNIIKNQSDINELNNKLSSIEQTNFKAIFDLVRPVGDVYVQYPQQANPNELWGAFSTWQVVNYDGAFFRAEGTNANAFIEKTGVLVKQANSIKSHNHNFYWEGSHRHSLWSGNDYGDKTFGFGQTSYSLGVAGQANPAGLNYRDIMGKYSNQVMSDTKIVVSGSTKNFGGDETRPDNFTMRIWKRIS